MSTFEFILVFSALLGVLALIAPLLHEHRLEWEQAQAILLQKNTILRCSSLADYSSAHYVLSPSSACVDYSFSINPPLSPFLLVLGGDTNHYG